LATDTLATVSEFFCDPDISFIDPKAENKTLVAAVDFVLQHSEQIVAGPGGLFDTLWRTLLGNKDDSKSEKAPSAWAEIFSLLFDASTGRSPTLPGQTYSARQVLPEGEGRLQPSSLGLFPDWPAFQKARATLIASLRNRRLGITKGGKLGLFPRHCAAGDSVWVLQNCHVPFLLRAAE
jgi:hypothetical protein